MTDDRRFQLYFEVFQRWGTPRELELILRWCSPEELAGILKAVGPPEDAEKLVLALKARSEDWKWASTTRVKLTTAAKLTLLIGAAVVFFRPLLQKIAEWWFK